MYSTHHGGKSIIAEILIKAWRNAIHEYIASVSKMCILIN